MAILVLCADVPAADRPATEPNSVFAASATAIANGQVEKSRMLGFSITKTPFQQLPSEGAILVGFELGLGRYLRDVEVIYALRPIYQTATGETIYESFGRFAAGARPVPNKHSVRDQATRMVRVQALPGYAVGGLTLRTDVRIRGLSVTFMRRNGRTLDPQQSYASDWVGDRTSGREESVNGDGAPVVGVFGNQDDQRVLALGLIYLKNPTPTAKLRAAPPRVEKPTQPPTNEKQHEPPTAPRVEKPLAPAAAPRVEKPAAPPPPEQPIQPFTVPPRNAAPSYRDPKWHYALELPEGWREMARGELDLINQFLRQRGLDQKVQYETGFRPSSSNPGSYPYILVQVKNPPTSYEEVERSIAKDLKAPLKEVQDALGNLAGDFSPGGAVLDRARNRILMRMNIDVVWMGKVESLTICHLGSKAVVALHCYALNRDFEKYLPVFTWVNDSFEFDKGYAFKPGGSALEEVGKALASWLPLVVFAAVTIPIFLVLLIFFIHKGNSPNRPAAEAPAGARITTPVVVSSLPRHEGQQAGHAACTDGSSAECGPSRLAPPGLEAAGTVATGTALEPLPFFTVLAHFTFKKNRLYRVYLRPQELLFLEAGPGIGSERAVQGAGVALGGLVGGLIGGLMVANLRDKAKARQWELDIADEAELLQMADQGDLNFHTTASDLSETRIEPPSFWDKLRTNVYGWLRFRHRDRGAYTLQFLTLEDMRKAVELLPRVLGDQLAVNAVLDRRNGRYVHPT